jgi:aminoglycoside phosphotransferase (APT) family kinase protein
MTQAAEPAARDGASDQFVDPAVQATQPWDRLAAHLRAHGHDFAAEPPPRQFAGGFGNLNYLITFDGRPAVLRRPPAGPLPPGGNDMTREHRVLSRLGRAFPLVPRTLHFSADESVLGAPFFIMEYRPGLVVRATLPDRLKDQGGALSRLLVDVLARLHAIDPVAVELGDLGRPDGFLERAVAGWIKRAGVAAADIYDDGRPPAPAREVASWLERRAIPKGDVTLLHNDFKLDNVILDPAVLPPEAIAVLDWDQCTRGDPLFDLATLLSYWTEPRDPPAMHMLNQMPSSAPGFLTRREVVELYGRVTGRDVSDFRFHRVLAMMKLGVIFLQLYARYKRGTTQDPRYKEMGRIGDGIFDFALDVARERVF